MNVDQHKHLGATLDPKLSFSAHIQAAISKSRKAIGMLRFLSKYLSRNTSNEFYKLYVRPPLDYGDVTYHIPQKEDNSSRLGNHLMEKLESVQYAAALAVTGTWRGTSRERLYNELGWGPLCLRRWSRRLILFYKFVDELTPYYTRDPIPPLNETTYPIRSRPVVGANKGKNGKIQSQLLSSLFIGMEQT